jgi:hypothetical protein
LQLPQPNKFLFAQSVYFVEFGKHSSCKVCSSC